MRDIERTIICHKNITYFIIIIIGPCDYRWKNETGKGDYTRVSQDSLRKTLRIFVRPKYFSGNEFQ